MLRVSPLAFGVCARVPAGMSAKLTAAISIRRTIATVSSRLLRRLTERLRWSTYRFRRGRQIAITRVLPPAAAGGFGDWFRDLSSRIGRVPELQHRPVPSLAVQ